MEKKPETMKENLQASVAAGVVLSNRLFIAQEVRQRNLLERLRDAVAAFEKDGDPVVFGTNFGRDVRFQIEQAARDDISRV